MTLTHRLRSIASIAGDARRDQVDALLRSRPALVRPLLEANDPRAIAEALVLLLAELEIETADHDRRLAGWTRLLGSRLGLGAGDLEQAELGALAHDVGKIAVEDAVLHSPLTLGPSELDRIRMHSSLGHALLFGIAGLRGAVTLVRTHHEYWDGTGYPDGLRAREIPAAARIFAFADSYDAMVRTDREFRSGVEHAAAAEELVALAGKKYDPEVVAAFRAIDPEEWLEIGRLK